MCKVNKKTVSQSREYGSYYQNKAADNYRNRNNNHWKFKIELIHNLVKQYVRPKHERKPKKDIVVVDVGCSIGTFAIEFAKLGYNSYGIDFDSSAIDIAKQLSIEENVAPKFVCGDVSNWSMDLPPIDIAICFDLFEHLHDDELGAFLFSLRKQFDDKGTLVFHTFPTLYDYIFYRRPYVGYPLFPLRNIATSKFNKIVKLYSCMIDLLLVLITGQTYKERIKHSIHCNPTTIEKLTEILNRVGYEIAFIDSSNIYNFAPSVQKLFCKQPATYRNLYGIATLTKKT